VHFIKTSPKQIYLLSDFINSENLTNKTHNRKIKKMKRQKTKENQKAMEKQKNIFLLCVTRYKCSFVEFY